MLTIRDRGRAIELGLGKYRVWGRFCVERLLSKPVWQGIGAVIGAVGVVISVAQLARPDEAVLPPVQEPTQQPSKQTGGVSVEGNGNCVNVGDGNNCTVSAPVITEDQNSLGVSPTWPMSLGCDGGTTVAAMKGDIAPGKVKRDPLKDIRAVLTKEHGAAYGRGSLSISLTAKVGTVVQIDNLKPIFYRDKATVQPEWVYDPMGGCGGSFARVFALNLDNHAWKDLGVVSDSDTPEGGKPPKGVPAETLGPRFHVSHDDPAVIVIRSQACTGYHEWGVELTYSTGGHTYTKVLGTEDAPFRSAGTPSRTTPVWTFMGGEDNTRLNLGDTTEAPKFC
ncbi:hypothetical protein [Kribbella yunnanensis]|uniref:hypothetical protein n=1 Tax=Kribbella yunnanensis TaxID=190194 RepID=UPI0031D2F0BC